ncbi:hypothetical protein IFM89_007635 [Coptis chinensis]|uniref:Uncharacterized protein n=1 Tax=Coptis chinensis TaxID=261450 RepID=A0A835HSC8_9MAGN|nr:hypothetical protein IFM89_007635 [Coptis chinensis]
MEVLPPDAHKRINHSIQGSYVAWKHAFRGSTHNCFREGEARSAIQGGMFLNFRCTSQGGVPWSPDTWALHDVGGNAKDFIDAGRVGEQEFRRHGRN